MQKQNTIMTFRVTSIIAAIAVSFVFVWNARAATYTYDANGRLVSADLGEGNYLAYTYDATGNMTAVSTQTTQATLSVAAGSGGRIVLPVQEKTTVVAGSPQAILAEPDEGNAFFQWTISGQGAIADPFAASTTVTLENGATVSLVANFATSVSLTVEQGENGTILPAGTVDAPIKKPYPVRATAAEGYRFVEWIVVAGSAKVANRYAPDTTVSVSSAATLTALFATQTCRMEMLVNPVGGGSVLPGGVSNPGLGEATAISAVPSTGFIFIGWSASDPGAVFGDAQAADTTVALYRDTTVTANFAPDGLDVTLVMEASEGGTTVPAPGTHTVNFGKSQSILAVAEEGFGFTKWSSVGNVAVPDPFDDETMATPNGNATVRANFAPSDEIARLVVGIIGDTGGTTSPSGGINVHVSGDNEVLLDARPALGYAFLGWEILEGAENVEIAAEFSAHTTAEVIGDAGIAARFEPNADSYEGKLAISLTLDGSAPGKDRFAFANMPLPGGFEFSEAVTVNIDGFALATDQGTWKTSGDLASGRVHVFKTDKADVRCQFTLTLDEKRGIWSLKGGKTTLDGIDNSNGVDVLLNVGDKSFANNYLLSEKTSWKFRRSDDPANWKALPTTLAAMDPFAIDVANGKHDGKKTGADSLTVSKGILPAEIPFDPATDAVVINVGALTVVLDRDMVKWKVSGQVFQYQDKIAGITARFDFVKGFWSLKMTRLNAPSIGLHPAGSASIRLAVQELEGGVEITTTGKTVLEYRATD
jgi:YD repeat-containing protein